jgi:two-component system chemotaxis response regulator CheY
LHGPTALRILIAEDDPDLRYIIKYMLTKAYPSAKIAAFSNGKEALEDFDANGAQLVVSNHDMPVMDGPTFVRHLRQRSADMPILMVSGSPEAQERGLEAGISLFLHKDELTAKLTSMTGFLLAQSDVRHPTQNLPNRRFAVED